MCAVNVKTKKRSVFRPQGREGGGEARMYAYRVPRKHQLWGNYCCRRSRVGVLFTKIGDASKHFSGKRINRNTATSLFNKNGACAACRKARERGVSSCPPWSLSTPPRGCVPSGAPVTPPRGGLLSFDPLLFRWGSLSSSSRPLRAPPRGSRLSCTPCTPPRVVVHSHALGFPPRGPVSSPICPFLLPHGLLVFVGALCTRLLRVMFLFCVIALSRASIQLFALGITCRGTVSSGALDALPLGYHCFAHFTPLNQFFVLSSIPYALS